MSCADFMGELFLARDVAHSVHINAWSCLKHNVCDKTLQNLIDEIIAVYPSAIYNLKFLA